MTASVPRRSRRSPSPPTRATSLFRWNVALAVLHGVQFLVMLALSLAQSPMASRAGRLELPHLRPGHLDALPGAASPVRGSHRSVGRVVLRDERPRARAPRPGRRAAGTSATSRAA